MASLPVRDPVGDQLLTPQNAALLVIDYQPSQFEGVNSCVSLPSRLAPRACPRLNTSWEWLRGLDDGVHGHVS
jgi:hypothetical protein